MTQNTTPEPMKDLAPSDPEELHWSIRACLMSGAPPRWQVALIVVLLALLASIALSAFASSFVTAFATIGILIATAVYAYFALGQWRTAAAILRQSERLIAVTNRACIVVGTIDTDERCITIVIRNTGNIEATARLRLVGVAVGAEVPGGFLSAIRTFEIGRNGGSQPLALPHIRDPAGTPLPQIVFCEVRYSDAFSEHSPLRICARFDQKVQRYVAHDPGDTWPDWATTLPKLDGAPPASPPAPPQATR